jgi:NAD-dependent SIR2 family protein deacetylase
MTQNIDNLEEKAGLDMERRVVQAHGANKGAHCSVCKRDQDFIEYEKHYKSGKIMYCQMDAIEKKDEEVKVETE